MVKFLLYAISLALLSHGQQETSRPFARTHNSSDYVSTCDEIAAAISGASQVFFPRKRVILSFCLRYSNLMDNPATPEYLLDISHASVSSSDASVCSVEPGSTEDVSKIVNQSSSDHVHRRLPTPIFHIASYFRVNPHAFCCERRRTCHESELFVNQRRTNRVVTLQQDKSR